MQRWGAMQDEVQDALGLWCCLWQVVQACAFLPQSAGLEEFDTLEALEDVALGANRLGRFKAWVLGHDGMKFEVGVQ